MKKVLVIIAILAFAGAGIAYLNRSAISDIAYDVQQPALPDPVSFEEVKAEAKPIPQPPRAEEEIVTEPVIVFEEEEEVEEPVVVEHASHLPPSVDLAVPFTPQAPHANWDMPYQEACEEASVYMVQQFYAGTSAGLIPAEKADADLLKIVDFENALFGYFEDTDALETSIFAEQLYGFANVELIENPTVNDIKEQIAAGRPVIVPAAGRQLRNPFFSGEGPRYHMFVIRGYTDDGFITNDPGTRRGERFVYSYSTIMDAMHDWNDGDVENGKKVVIVIHPE